MGDTPRRRRRAWSLQLAGLVVLLVVLAAGAAALGEEHEQGLLLLRLGPDANEFEWTTHTQEIVVDGCEAHLDTSGAVLVEVTQDPAMTLKGDPDVPVFGLFNHGAGSKTKGKGGNGQPCGRVDGPDEAIEIVLANETGDLAEGLAIGRADLDVERKFDVAVAAELYLTIPGEMESTEVMVARIVLPPAADSDSGPDSNDHWRWVIDVGVPFDRIRLDVDETTPDGAFSLDGGATGLASSEVAGWEGITESIFELVLPDFDGVVACGGATHTEGDGEDTPQAIFTRGSNNVGKGGDPDCPVLVSYTLDATADDDEQEVSFVFDDEVLPTWLGTIVWAPETAVVPVPATELDEDGDGTFESDLDWCDGFVLDPVTGDPVIDPALGEPRPVMPMGKSWCLVDQQTSLIDAVDMQVTQKIYGITDPSFGRPR